MLASKECRSLKGKRKGGRWSPSNSELWDFMGGTEIVAANRI